eukprot:gene29523-64026_t
MQTQNTARDFTTTARSWCPELCVEGVEVREAPHRLPDATLDRTRNRLLGEADWVGRNLQQDTTAALKDTGPGLRAALRRTVAAGRQADIQSASQARLRAEARANPNTDVAWLSRFGGVEASLSMPQLWLFLVNRIGQAVRCLAHLDSLDAQLSRPGDASPGHHDRAVVVKSRAVFCLGARRHYPTRHGQAHWADTKGEGWELGRRQELHAEREQRGSREAELQRHQRAAEQREGVLRGEAAAHRDDARREQQARQAAEERHRHAADASAELAARLQLAEREAERRQRPAPDPWNTDLHSQRVALEAQVAEFREQARRAEEGWRRQWWMPASGPPIAGVSPMPASAQLPQCRRQLRKP